MLVPMLFVILSVDPLTATIGTMAVNLGMLFWIRKTFKNGLSNIFGTKMKWQCLICQNNKFDSTGKCYRCGMKQRRTV